jgi:hypothetical protein
LVTTTSLIAPRLLIPIAILSGAGAPRGSPCRAGKEIGLALI